MKLEHFFSIAVRQPQFNIDYFIKAVGLTDKINKNGAINKLIKLNGADHPIVSIAKRQNLLRELREIINHNMMPYNPYYYTKEINTSSKADRKYGAEEKLLELALVVATGKPYMKLEQENFIPNVQTLRDLGTKQKPKSEHFTSILNDHTRDRIKSYKKTQAPVKPKKKSFFPGLFKKAA
ncbi:MAG: hypothetical protein HON94_09800 [Methylococcales bacterium]|jgi:hypothetical protein|nr:hypothetical protein [Methylococcales bacterium]MBT7409097.1 hypothetical protein [Methylococcales bacterium]